MRRNIVFCKPIMKIIINDTPKDTYVALTEAMSEVFKKIHDRDVFLAVSGGNTPARLFDLWVYKYEHQIDWHRVQIFWVDERCVPPGDNESNYRMTVTHLLSKLPFMQKHIHRIHGEASPQEEALRYGEIIRKLLPWEEGLPVFDLILLGVGSDGHTASIFPDDPVLFSQNEALCDLETKVCYDTEEFSSEKPVCRVTSKPDSGQKRVTLTMPVINNARHVFVLVTGADKQEVLSQLFNHTPVSATYPASFVNPRSGKLIYFVDREAATPPVKPES